MPPACADVALREAIDLGGGDRPARGSPRRARGPRPRSAPRIASSRSRPCERVADAHAARRSAGRVPRRRRRRGPRRWPRRPRRCPAARPPSRSTPDGAVVLDDLGQRARAAGPCARGSSRAGRRRAGTARSRRGRRRPPPGAGWRPRDTGGRLPGRSSGRTSGATSSSVGTSTRTAAETPARRSASARSSAAACTAVRGNPSRITPASASGRERRSSRSWTVISSGTSCPASM